MKAKVLSERIFNDLNSNGAGLGNKSITIIRHILDEYLEKNPDTRRLDKLQNLTNGYGRGWVLRNSTQFRGMRLHESTDEKALPSIRDAIDIY